VSFSPDDVLSRLRALQDNATGPARYVLAFSGGLDSTVLLHALAATQTQHAVSLLAVHVDHQLHAESGAWASHCASVAATYGVPFEARQVEVAAGAGPEAAARDARYLALRACMHPDDWLLCAHHADDQAETLLLNLLRGSGPAGLAAMQSIRRFGPGWQVRPLLDTTRAELETFAQQQGLAWQEDPSNQDPRFDRNFLRRQVLPLISQRWPTAQERLVRSASLARDASDLLAELADLDLARCPAAPGRLRVQVLRELSASRRANLLRRACQLAALPAPPATRVAELGNSLLGARQDAEPVVRWRGAELRRYRDEIFLLPETGPANFDGASLGVSEPVPLGPGLGRLVLVDAGGPGIDPTLVSAGLVLRQRQGGEQIKLSGHAHTSKLKKLLQQDGVLPWRRDELPLVYAGDQLLAVADLWTDARCIVERGYAVKWLDRPAII
tara:strand:- start:1326 stop:2654 length:1329 start_codon:yes stop_codon:yes gene_type:complete